ncbi:MAG TPA: hypothetical protein VGP73_21330 [Thermoanaerobaculia bacterium]
MRKKMSLWILAALLAVPFALRGAQLDLLSAVPAGRASDTALGTSQPAAVSADGRYLAFLSDARNLVAGQADRNDGSDVFLYDRVTGKTVLVSHATGSPATAADAPSSSVSMSRDGRWIVFASVATDLLAGPPDPGKLSDVFLYDRVSGRTSLVSRSRASASTPGNGISDGPAMSADGRWIAFRSEATDLVNGQADTNLDGDVFLYDRQSGRTSLVSRAAGAPARTGNARSGAPSISADGRWVAFPSDARDLVPGGTVGGIYVWDRVTGAMVESPGAGFGFISLPLSISGNGECVVYSSVFNSEIPGQQDLNGGSDVFLFHRPTRATKLVSHAFGSQTRAGDEVSTAFSVSDDCGWVAFESYAGDLVAGGPEGSVSLVYLYERASGRVSLASRLNGSPPAAGGFASLGGLSADGGTVVFLGSSPELLDPPKETSRLDVILYDRRSGRTSLVSQVEGAAPNHGGNGNSSAVVVGPDGKWVAFASSATDLEAGVKDLNQAPDVYLWSRSAAAHELVTRRDAAGASRTAVEPSAAGALSADGRYAVFTSRADDLLQRLRDQNNSADVFVYDRVARTTRLVSRSMASPQQTANGWSDLPSISADGRFIVYESSATDLVPGQAPQVDPHNVRFDAFLYDRLTGTTTLVTRPGQSLSPDVGEPPRISADGSAVAFVSAGGQVILYDRPAKTYTLVSHAEGSPSTPAEFGGNSLAISADGRFVAFNSDSLDLAPIPPGRDSELPQPRIYLYDRSSGKVTLVGPTEDFLAPVLSGEGRWVVFVSSDKHVVPGQVDVDFTPDLFLWDRTTGTTRLLTHVPGSAVTTVGTVSDKAGTFGLSRFSADGRWLLFGAAGVLVTGQASDKELPGLFFFDTTSGSTAAVGTVPGATSGGGPSVLALDGFSLSPDGRYVAFVSPRQPAGDQTLQYDQVYLYDRVSGRTVLVSATLDAAAVPGDGSSGHPAVAAGGLVLFDSGASNFTGADFNNTSDVFLYSPGAPGR